MMIAIAASGLCRRYGRHWALKNVDFEVAEGSAVMITGPNGSGKSTLLRVLATALRADRGLLRIAGYDAARDPESVRGMVSLLGQRTQLYELLTALENLAIFARFLGSDARPAALQELLEGVGLAGRGDDPVHTFSAGMRQRLALGKVLLKKAPVVLLDEPYGHLDPQGFGMVDALLKRMRREGTTVLMATHLLERGRAFCDRALGLESGRVVFSGASSELPAGAPLEGLA